MHTAIRATGACLAALLLAAASPTQSLVRDVTPGFESYNPGSYPRMFVGVGGRVLVGGNANNGTRALWSTDGTASTTPLQSFNSRDFGEAVEAGGAAYFTFGGPPNHELWKTDGTWRNGVVLGRFRSIRHLRSVNGTVFFAAETLLEGEELWRTDGTVAGTVMVADLNPGPASSEPGPVATDGFDLYFAANDGSEGRELWRMGSPLSAPVQLVMRPGSAGFRPEEITRVGFAIYYTAEDGASGRELWRTNVSGHRRVADIMAGSASSTPQHLTESGGRLFFSAKGPEGREPWVAENGRARLLADLNPGPPDSTPESFLAVNGEVAFSAFHPSFGRELVLTLGSATSTRLVDIAPGAASSNPLPIRALSAGIVFKASTPNPGLWRIQPNSNGLTTLSDVDPVGVLRLRPLPVAEIGGRVLFAGVRPGEDSELWATDGTRAGTRRIADLAPPPPATSGPTSLVEFQGLLYLRMITPANGMELWRSDGTAAGTQMVQEINPGQPSAAPAYLTVAGDRMFFRADDGVHGDELWVTDGVTAQLTRNVGPGDEDGSTGHIGMVGNRRVVFAGDDGQSGRELWFSDGTKAGTQLLVDINPSGNGLPVFVRFWRMKGATYFFGTDPDLGLWRTDGTAGGTVRLAVFPPGTIASFGSMKPTTNKLFFTIDTPAEGGELWASDGTPGGTKLVREIQVGPDGGKPLSMEPLGGNLVFSADDGVHGREPWFSDGTATGTWMIADVMPGPDSSYADDFTEAGDRAFFRAFAPGVGRELCWTKGTPGSFQLVEDIAAGLANSMNGTAMMAHLGSSPRVIFSGERAASGLELSTSDGTAPGTSRLQNLATNPWGSDPYEFVRIGRQIFFTAWTPAAGRELWVVDVADARGVLAEPYGTASFGTHGGQARILPIGWPSLGNARFEAKLRNARPNAPAVLQLAATRAAVPIGAAPCTWYVGAPAIGVPTTTSATGEVRVPLPVPAVAGLAGADLFLQYAYIDPGGCFAGVASFSHGLWLVPNW